MPAGRVLAILLLPALALAACTSTKDALVARGFSPGYAQGYEHGCANGKADVGGLFVQAQKDEASYAASDGPYAQG